MRLVVFILLCWGLAYIVTASAIMAPVRTWLGRKNQLLSVLIYCAACSGFWIGLGLGLAHVWPLERVLVWAPLDAAIVSCGAMAIIASFVPNDAWQHEQVDIADPEQPER